MCSNQRLHTYLASTISNYLNNFRAGYDKCINRIINKKNIYCNLWMLGDGSHFKGSLSLYINGDQWGRV